MGQPAVLGERVGGGVGDLLIVGAAGLSLIQKGAGKLGVNRQQVFHRVGCILAVITSRVFSQSLGALNAPFGPVIAERGKAEAGAGEVP
jgi:hypothetical protein